MPSPFTGSAEEQQRFKQHSTPKAFEYYMKEVEKTKNEATRPSPTPMASSPAALPATTRLAAGSASPEPTRKPIFTSSALSSTTHEQPKQSHQYNQSNQSINQSIQSTNQPNQSIQSINQSIPPTHQDTVSEQRSRAGSSSRGAAGNGKHVSAYWGHEK